MVLSALTQRRVDGRALARELNRPRWVGPLPFIRRIPNWATFPWGVVDALRQHGLRAEWRWAAPPHLLREGLSRGWVLLPPSASGVPSGRTLPCWPPSTRSKAGALWTPPIPTPTWSGAMPKRSPVNGVTTGACWCWRIPDQPSLSTTLSLGGGNGL